MRHFSLPFRRKKIQRTHVVQTVGKLDNDDADILRHGDKNFAEIFRFRLFFRLEHDFIEFGYARNKLKHLVAEFAAHVLFVRLGILDDVVQQRRRNRIGVESELDQNFRYRTRVNKVRFARRAPLVTVRILGKIVCVQQHITAFVRVIFVYLP